MSPFEQGPYLLAALLCEKVLVEQDGTKSAIRIIDRVTRTVASPSPPEKMEPFEYELTLLIRLKSGGASGTYPLQTILVKPSGERLLTLQESVEFKGEEDSGVDVIATMRIKFGLPGIYWFEIYLRDVCLTRLPLRVVYLAQVKQPGGDPA